MANLGLLREALCPLWHHTLIGQDNDKAETANAVNSGLSFFHFVTDRLLLLEDIADVNSAEYGTFKKNA